MIQLSGDGDAGQAAGLAIAIEQSPAAVLMTDERGRIQYVNRRFSELTGYGPAEVLGRTPRLLQSGLTPAATYQDLRATLLAGEVWRGELCNRRKDGSAYWHSMAVAPVRDTAGRVTGFVAVQEDITAQRRAAEALALRDRDYRRIVETATEGIWEVDAENRTTFVNERLAAMLGYRAEEILGRSMFDFTDAEGRAIAEVSLARLRQAVRERLDFKLIRSDGSALWVLMSTGPILDEQGRYRGALAMVTDLTGRRSAEAALRRSEAWFRSLIEGGQDLIAIVSPGGCFRYVSPSFTRVLGYQPCELIGQNVLDFLHPDDRRGILEAVKEAGSPGSVCEMQGRFRHKNGTWRLLDGTGRNLADDPVVMGTVFNGRDVTERAGLEAQLRHAQKMEAMGRLVAGVAHDFNNLLAVILTASELMRRDLPAGHRSRDDVEEIENAAERGATLTRQLLAFTRQQVLQPRVLDLNRLVIEARGMLRCLLGEEITLETRLPADPVSTTADPSQLEQVLLNLVVNARDAMPAGGRLVVETAVVEVDDAFAGQHQPMHPGRHVMLSVTDTGVGMSHELQARVFEPFFTTKEPGKGTGLGLSTVYGIVKQSGGFIWLYSEPGAGTCFKIYLPHTEGPLDPVSRMSETAEEQRGTETVLIADDDPAVRQAVRRALERFGYTLLEASGRSALGVARGYPGVINLLLTDVMMPGITGPQLARELRKDRPELRVVYMSGYSDAVLRSRVSDDGCVYLQKPFTVPELGRRVREALDAEAPA